MKSTNLHACLILMDIDHFKQFNVLHGHPVGDFVIAEFARILQSIGKRTTAARWGGEEFLILVPGASAQDGVNLAEHLRLTIELNPFIFEGEPLHVTASFGVAVLDLAEANALMKAYRDADEALLRMKPIE